MVAAAADFVDDVKTADSSEDVPAAAAVADTVGAPLCRTLVHWWLVVGQSGPEKWRRAAVSCEWLNLAEKVVVVAERNRNLLLSLAEHVHFLRYSLRSTVG